MIATAASNDRVFGDVFGYSKQSLTVVTHQVCYSSLGFDAWHEPTDSVLLRYETHIS